MIKVSDLHKTYNRNRRNEVRAIDGVDLELGETGLCAIYGKSGSGKTSLLNAIGGLDTFNGGKVEIDGISYEKSVSDAFRIANIGYIFQNYLLDDQVTVYENVARGLKTVGVRDEETIFTRVMTALSNVGMDKYYRRKADTLSGGQQQRVAIARAMVKGAKIILADEPTGNLDEYNTKIVMEILKAMSEKCLVVLVTHEHNLIEQYADKVIEIADGKVILRENRTAFGERFEDKTKVFLGEMDRKEIEAGNVTLEIYGDGAPIRLRLVCAGGKYYLTSSEEKIRWIDEKSEIRFIEGRKEEYFAKRNQTTKSALKALDKIEPQDLGKVFTLRECFAGGIKSIVGRKKKRNIVLSLGVLAFSVALIFLISSFGSSYKEYQSAGSGADPYLVTANCSSEEEQEEMLALAKEYGMFYDCISIMYYGNAGVRLSFELSGFESFSGNGYGASYTFYDKTVAADMTFTAGAPDPASENIYVSSALAVELLDSFEESSGIDGLEFDNIMKSKATYNGDNSALTASLNVVGIVEWDQPCVFVDETLYYEDLYGGMYNVAVDQNYGLSAADGEVLIHKDYAEGNTSFAEGKKLTFGKKEFTIRYFDGEFCSYFLINEREMKALPFDYENWGSLRLVMYARDSDALAQKLNESYPGAYASSKASVTEEEKERAKSEMIENGVSILIVGALLFAGMYLLVYASTSARSKEIGIYRAIGVTKGNVLLKFFYESLALLIFSVGIAFLLIGLPITVFSETGKLTGGLFLPWWLYLSAFAAVSVLMLFICVLPVILFLRKSPVAVLSKYDI